MIYSPGPSYGFWDAGAGKRAFDFASNFTNWDLRSRRKIMRKILRKPVEERCGFYDYDKYRTTGGVRVVEEYQPMDKCPK